MDDAKDPILTKRPQEYLDDNSRLQTIDTMHGFCDNVIRKQYVVGFII